MHIFRLLLPVRSLVLTLLAGFGLAAGAGWVVYHHYARDLPDFEQLKRYAPDIVTRVHAADGTLLAEYARQRRIFVPIATMPPLIVSAVVAAEDREFYTHPGVDLRRMAGAALTNLLHAGSGHRMQGASTITQQVARIFLLTNDYSTARKIKEAILAVRIEQALTKDQILELYLNAPDFGHGAYGVAAASLTYFDKSLDQLTLPEAALLAGLLKGPSYFDPFRHPDRAKERRDYVIDGMAKMGAISEADAVAAIAEPVTVRRRSEADTLAAPYPADEVRRELVQRYGEETLMRGGLSVRTSIDPAMQTLAERTLRDGLVAYDHRHGWRGPIGHASLPKGEGGWLKILDATAVPPGAAAEHWELAIVLGLTRTAARIGLAHGDTGEIALAGLAWTHVSAPGDILKTGDLVLVEAAGDVSAKAKGPPQYALRQIPNVSGGLVALDPHTGRVLALSGGWSWDLSQFDRATQAKRQIGSTMKPFAYLAALENGMTPSTMIDSKPIEVDQGPGLPPWRPKNFESSEDWEGPRTLRFAIEHSVNTMTVRMASTIGIDKIAPYVERLGILDHMPREYSMVLGAGETTLLRLTAAYAMLDNGGKKIEPSLIDRVQDRNGITIFTHDERRCPRCRDLDWAPPGEVPVLTDDRPSVLDPGTAYQMVNILTGVVQRGTAASVGAHLKMPLAGKTGTTNGPNDAWFVGFTPDLVVGVFIGFDDPHPLGNHEQGAVAAAPVFDAFMTQALAGKPAVDFRIPPGVRLVRVNAETGRLADPGDRDIIWEAFKPGTEPVSSDAEQQVVEGSEGIDTIGPNDPGDGTDAPQPARTNIVPSTGGSGLY